MTQNLLRLRLLCNLNRNRFEATSTDQLRPARLAELWAAEGWPARPDDTGRALTAEFSPPSAGPPPWHVYRIEPRSAVAVKTVEPGGATRWYFDS